MGYEERVTTVLTCDKCDVETVIVASNSWPDGWFIVDLYDTNLLFDDYKKEEMLPEEAVLCQKCFDVFLYKKYLGEIAASTWFYSKERREDENCL